MNGIDEPTCKQETVYDTGGVTLTVNGVTSATTSYGATSTPNTIASGLAAGIASGSPVSISAQNDTIQLTSTTTGSGTNYSYSLSFSSTDGFSPSSFSASPSSGALTGGADAQTQTTGTPVYYYDLAYDPDSNVVGYGDQIMGTWAFTYDTLNRLATATQGAAPTPPAGLTNVAQSYFPNYCWSYDQWGNRTQQYGSSTSVPSGSGGATICDSQQPSFSYNTKNQIISSPTGAPQYDAAGDITTGTSDNSYLYDAEGRICSVNKAGVMTGYVYDASGNRVAKGPITMSTSCDPTTNGFEGSGQESDYIQNQSGQTVTKTTMGSNGAMQWDYTNVYADGQLFATYDSSLEGNAGLYFLLNDWLGTRRETTNDAGVVEQICASLPYGDGTNCSQAANVPNEQHFTGKTHDSESGLDYFGARYYASNDARFMSPDSGASPILGVPLPYAYLRNPQSLNLYSYVLNNPLGGVDPDGHDCVVQTITGDNTERVTDYSGTCSGITVGDGQSKTYVAGKVDFGTIRSDGSGGITFSYTPYNQSDSSGTADLNGAPFPNRPALDPNFGNNASAEGYFRPASQVVDTAGAVEGIALGAVSLPEDAVAGLLRAPESAGLAGQKIVAYLESRGIPAFSALRIATKLVIKYPKIRMGIHATRFYLHKINQMVTSYEDSHQGQ